jgi:hypothetical protein
VEDVFHPHRKTEQARAAFRFRVASLQGSRLPLQASESVGFREKRQHFRFAGAEYLLQLLQVAGQSQFA